MRAAEDHGEDRVVQPEVLHDGTRAPARMDLVRVRVRVRVGVRLGLGLG